MARTYRQTLESLYARVRFGERPGLEGPRRLDERLGFPSRAMPGLIIGGTNGKGSTAAFVEALLRQTGLAAREILSSAILLHPLKAALLHADIRSTPDRSGLILLGPYEFMEVQILEIRPRGAA